MSHDRATSLELRRSGSAAPPGQGAMGARLQAMIERLEIDAAEREIDALDAAGRLDPGVLEAEMMIALGACDISRGLGVAARITAAGAWDDVLAIRPSVGTFAVIANVYAARVARAERLADRIPPGFEWEVARSWLGLAVDIDGLRTPARKGSPLDALIVRLRVVRGELGQVRRPALKPLGAGRQRTGDDLAARQPRDRRLGGQVRAAACCGRCFGRGGWPRSATWPARAYCSSTRCRMPARSGRPRCRQPRFWPRPASRSPTSGIPPARPPNSTR